MNIPDSFSKIYSYLPIYGSFDTITKYPIKGIPLYTYVCIFITTIGLATITYYDKNNVSIEPKYMMANLPDISFSKDGILNKMNPFYSSDENNAEKDNNLQQQREQQQREKDEMEKKQKDEMEKKQREKDEMENKQREKDEMEKKQREQEEREQNRNRRRIDSYDLYGGETIFLEKNKNKKRKNKSVKTAKKK